MQYDSPGYHFTSFRSDWLDLTWTLVSSTLDVAEIVQDETNGVNEGRKSISLNDRNTEVHGPLW